MKNFLKIPVVLTAAVFSGMALAEGTGGVDVSGAVSSISDGMSAVGAIGVAVLTVLGGAVVFKLIRRAM
jgi:hypothetical protein